MTETGRSDDRLRRSLVDVRLQEPRQAVEVGLGLDVADHGHQRLGIDQLLERHVVQLQLAGDRDHHAVELLFDQRPIGADAQLAAEHDVEGVRLGAARLVAELQAGDLALAAGLRLVFFGDQSAKTAGPG